MATNSLIEQLRIKTIPSTLCYRKISWSYLPPATDNLKRLDVLGKMYGKSDGPHKPSYFHHPDTGRGPEEVEADCA